MVEGYVWEHIYRNDVKNQYQDPKRRMAEVGVEPGPSHMQSREVTTGQVTTLSTHGRRTFTIFAV